MAYPMTYERVLDLVAKLPRSSRIVDLGCGKGEIVRGLRKLGFKDIAYADKTDRFDGKVAVMDFNEKLSYPKGIFDVIISTEVVNCLRNHQRFFQEVIRIARPDATVILSFPNIQNLPNKLYYLFTGRFIDQVDGEFGPFFLFQIPKTVAIEQVTYNRGFLPILRMPMPRGRLFGQTVILKGRLGNG